MEKVNLQSLGDQLSGALFMPAAEQLARALVVCHGAGEYKENHFELCEYLAARGTAALAIDMHGHGQSKGERFCVRMVEWSADVRAAVDFLAAHPRIDRQHIGAFGFSSGGTVIIEAALVEPRLKALVLLDATVRNSDPLLQSLAFHLLDLLGRAWVRLTGRQLRVSLMCLAKISGAVQWASDLEVNRQIATDPRFLEALNAFPFPGATECFLVDTLRRVPQLSIPTLVLWGEEDKVDPPETARLLYAALGCRKELVMLPGSGHFGHLDRQKEQVFKRTARWEQENL